MPQEFENMTVKVEGNKVTLIILDHTKDYGPSPSGKTHRVATTGGNVAIDGTNGLVIGLNAYRKP